MSTSHPASGDEHPARYLVGIDLGTTNSALAYLDTKLGVPRVRDFPIAQVVAPGEIEVRPVLPSFGYEPSPAEFPPGMLAGPGVPGGEHVVGWFARWHGAQVPGRLVASAKSWLCHPGVNRTAPLLPWHGAEDVRRISPVEASARYLAHLRAAWDLEFPSEPLAGQEVVVTVPASFDEVARELTVRAAEQAGLPRVTLLEEPQAAFYAWMAALGGTAEEGIHTGQLTLICDVGGGTSDFTLIEARPADEGRVRFHRVAVGEHLILGGDNMDLALAHHLEGRLAAGGRLDPRRWSVLVQTCRGVKETLLGAHAPERMGVSVAVGARLVGGAVSIEITREEVRSLLVDGFFPRVDASARPATVRSGFQEFGLPYAADAAVTRHLAAFLAGHSAGVHDRGSGTPFPDRVLFNGGVFESPVVRVRLLEVLNQWRAAAGAPAGTSMEVLPNDRLDLAVARGAAYSALLRRQRGRRIAAGLARSYHIQVGRAGGTDPTAVCLAPAGLEEGEEVVLPQPFTLRLREPVEFAVFSSATRLHDRAGDLVTVDPAELTALPPIRTVVGSGRSREAGDVGVQLHARLTEIGTLDVRCVETGRRRSWKLEFDVRGTVRKETRSATDSGVSMAGAPEEALVEACVGVIRRVLDPAPGEPGEDPAALMRRLEQVTGQPRDQWPLPLLRALWDALTVVEPGRRRGVMHEARWLNLVGFALRPGYGFAVDDWRVQQTWRWFQGGTAFPKNEMCRAEWCILWRRVAGGLGFGHQRALGEAYAASHRSKGGKKLHLGPHETAEIWRLLGSLELLPATVKTEIGTALAERLGRRLEPSLLRAGLWALGRLGARVPAYGPLNTLVSAEIAERWAVQLMEIFPDPATGLAQPELEALFTVAHLARLTGDRYRDLPDETRTRVLAWLERHGATQSQQDLVRSGGALGSNEEEQVFGESLPPGLHLAGEE